MTIESKLREGTEILRTGGGISLTSTDCNTLIDFIEAAKDLGGELCPSVGGGMMLRPNNNGTVETFWNKLEKVQST